MTEINRTHSAAAEEELFRSFEPYFRSLDPALFDAYEQDIADDQGPSDEFEDMLRRRFVTDLAWMTPEEMADLNAQQRRHGEAVTSLTPEQQLAWRETPRPGPHMEVR